VEDRITKYIIIGLAAFVIYFMYEQHKEITYLKETILIQDQAIKQQNTLISIQKMYMDSYHTQQDSPIINKFL